MFVLHTIDEEEPELKGFRRIVETVVFHVYWRVFTLSALVLDLVIGVLSSIAISPSLKLSEF
jgi:hypothetical protein